MNDLEDLVRAEMRARVAAAEAAAADEQRLALFADLARRIRKARLRRRWTASALSAAALTAAVALPLTFVPGPTVRMPPPKSVDGVALTDMAATPRGWVPVTYREAQISVPADWQVTSTPPCDNTVPGYVVVGTASTKLVLPRSCRLSPNMAAISAIPRAAAGGRATTTVNGLGVVQIAGAPGYLAYLVPSLHVRVQAWGPLASRVTATITRSPLSVVLARGRPFRVPAHWRWYDIGGMAFAAPARWALVRNGYWGCGYVYPARVVLVPAAHARLPMPGCVAPGTAAGMEGRPGVIVVASGGISRDRANYDGCRLLHGLRACYSAGDFGIPLDMAVFMPGQQRVMLVEIGLAGNGVTARTIFDSIGPG